MQTDNHVKPDAEPASVAPVRVQPVVRQHPWRNSGANYLKLKEARKIAQRKQQQKYNDENREFRRMTWRVATHKRRNQVLPNDKVSDGGPLTHESKQDANPPFAAPLG